MKALSRLNKNNSLLADPTSSIQTVFFKLLATAGLVYGLTAIIATIYIIKYILPRIHSSVGRASDS